VTDVTRNGTDVRRNVTQADSREQKAEAEADREQKAEAEKKLVRKEHIKTPSSSTAAAADPTPPFFASVVLTEAEAKARWSAHTYRHFWNGHVPAEASLTTMSPKWVQAIDDFQERRGLTPATFLAALKEMEQKKPIEGSTDFYNAMNLAVRDE
jgi:hypothetical protein